MFIKYFLTFFLFYSSLCNSQFFEDFENGVPGSMTEQYIVDEESWVSCYWGTLDRSGGVPCPLNGDFTATFFNFTTDSSTSLETPLLDLTSDLYRLKFLHAQKNLSTSNNDLYVEISTDAGATWTLVELFNYNIPVPIEESFDLQSYNPTDETVIRFRAIFNWGYSILLDDISITPIPDNDIKMVSVDIDPIVSDTQIPITGSFKNYGLNTINSVELNWKLDSENSIHSQELTNLNLAPGDIYNYHHNDVLQAPFGLNFVKVWLSNLNGIDNDEDSSNNVLVKKINVASAVVAKQRVLYEEFTSSTCGPCYYFNTEYFNDDFLDFNEENIALIKYQMYWPGSGDPYYTVEGGVRREYYGVFGVPDLKLEGVDGRFYDTQILQDNLDAALQLPSYFLIDATHSLTASGLIDIDVTIVPYIGDYYRVHIVVVEKETYDNAMNNGETYFRNVMMKMLPDGEGTLLNFIPNEPVNLTFSEDLSNTFIEEMDDLEVIVFVQNEEYNKTVMQSQLSVLETLGVNDEEKLDLYIYPNPSQEKLKVSTSENVDISIVDCLGKEVLSFKEVTNITEMDISILSSAIYFVRVYGENFVEIKKLIVD